MHYHTIVIGAGPAGLFAAQSIGKQNKNVLILEKNTQAGKKLLISGSGQCNFTHSGDIEAFFTRYGDQAKFLKKAFGNFTNQDAMQFFHKHGIGLDIRENGKVFPKSGKSQDVLDVLLLKCRKHNVQIKCNQAVKNISTYDKVFAIETTDGNRYFSNNVVVATGGMSYPHTGAQGDGYGFAESLGHTVVTPRPALTYVTTQEKEFAALSGIAVEHAQITVLRNQKQLKVREGSILFTHKGLSGPAILDSTRWIQQGDQLVVNFVYPSTFEQIRNQFTTSLDKCGKESILSYLRTLELPKSFCQLLCDLNKINAQTPCARIIKKERELLVASLTKRVFNISGLGGLHVAMVTAGGVSLKQVNPTTMESRKLSGLYFVGEVLDIDGDTGGYNIQAAFSTANLCAEHINIKNKR